MTVTVNCGTGDRQPRRQKICRVFDSETGKGCQLAASHVGLPGKAGRTRIELFNCGPADGLELVLPTPSPAWIPFSRRS